MDLQRLYSYTRQALKNYNMIDSGDKVAIGLSGGKDSLALLYALSGLSKFYPNKFTVVAIMVNLGFENLDYEAAKSICESLGVDFYIVNTQIYNIVFEEKKLKNPCSLCAKMRKGALNSKALELGCNKIAYAHHKDDIVETYFMSLFYEGRFNTILPVTTLDDVNLAVIRPLMYISESEIIGLKNKLGFKIVNNPCPADGYTKRQYIKEKLSILNKENPGVKDKIFNAIISDFYPKIL